MLEKEFEIASLIAGYRAGILTEEEKACLQEWMDSSPSAKLLFEKLDNPENFRKLCSMAQKYDRGRAWSKIEKSIRRERNLKIQRYIGYAASFVLPLAVCYFLLKNSAQECCSLSSHQMVCNDQIQPGTTKAILTLGDGTVVDLEKENSFEVLEEGGAKIRKDSACLNYQNETKIIPEQEVVYNRIDIPRGGEYTLKLSDGSRVHLNAMSSLRYPVNFTGDKRIVELQGEAYFEVVKAGKPFIVKAGDVEVKVLGTEFNVSCYVDEDIIGTTLVKGCVNITTPQAGPLVLTPSQQANFSRETKDVQVKIVDVSEYTAWKEGYFRFKDWRLEDIMNYLSRWYDMHVFYANPKVKDLRFGCSISRYGSVEPILQLLEDTRKVRVEIKGNTIVFR